MSSQGSTINHTLSLGVFLSMDPEDPSQESIGFLPALDLAIETINNHSEVLKNLGGVSYTLEVIISDSMVWHILEIATVYYAIHPDLFF